MNREVCGRKLSWSNLRFYANIGLKGLCKTLRTSVRIAGLRVEI
jgi:hypothetical protein